jgi:SAM-dependent methyltransferase
MDIVKTENNMDHTTPQPDQFLKRIIDQSKLLEGDPSKYLFQFGLKKSDITLEMGSCIGLHCKKIARAIYPGKVYSLDIDFDYASYQKINSDPDLKIEIINGDAHFLPIPSDSCDFVYSRFLFQHLINPLQAMEETIRVLKKGGKTVIVDTDDYFDMFSPWNSDNSFISEAYIALAKLQELRGGNRYIGRNLIPLLVDAGFNHVGISIVPTVQIGSRNKDLIIKDIIPMFKEEYENLINLRLITEDHLNLAIKTMETTILHNNSFYIGLIFIAYGEK